MAETEAKRVRRKIGYDVLCVQVPIGDKPNPTRDSFRRMAGPFDDQLAAQKWIKASGEAGSEYVVSRFVFGPVTVKVEPTVKRSLE